uniref:Integrase catalytic domain-containing protein n=1 Tax=Heterorhabditis bacteriophora TaxID=37862 RepID=A0A1I7X6Z9_HETBA
MDRSPMIVLPLLYLCNPNKPSTLISYSSITYTSVFTLDNIIIWNEAYICLFTCLVTRAVHLECVENLSASAFLRALQRFIARRGVPSIIRSDQGSNFILAEYILSKINDKYHFQNTPVKGFIENEKIKWIFNPPSSRWMGGVWERLVQSVKRAYIKVIGRKKLSFVEMNTIIINIEAILNSRPITHVDHNDISAVPIRPIDFISQRLKFSLPFFISIEEETDPDYVIRPIQTIVQTKQALQSIDQMLNKFWEAWHTVYLSQLREIHGIRLRKTRHGVRSIPEAGEIVLIENPLMPRGTWYCGLIVKLVKSLDGKIRSAKVKASNGRYIHRPINKLYPMEIRANIPIPIFPSDEGDVNLEEEFYEEDIMSNLK